MCEIQTHSNTGPLFLTLGLHGGLHMCEVWTQLIYLSTFLNFGLLWRSKDVQSPDSFRYLSTFLNSAWRVQRCAKSGLFQIFVHFSELWSCMVGSKKWKVRTHSTACPRFRIVDVTRWLMICRLNILLFQLFALLKLQSRDMQRLKTRSHFKSREYINAERLDTLSLFFQQDGL